MAQSLIENPMRRVRVQKVVVNSSIGESGARLERAAKILEGLTGQRPSFRKAKKTIRGFGIHKGEPIALTVTLRGDKALSFLKRALAAIGNKLHEGSFDEYGNFAFGIKEHLDVPGTRYDPSLGIIGMDVIVNLGRPGFRVMYRRIKRSKVGRRHRLSREEGIEFVKRELGALIMGEE